jgi:transposase-like protein
MDSSWRDELLIWEDGLNCPECGSAQLRRTGLKRGAQRYCCKVCGRYCTDKAPKFSAQTKAMAMQMYLNSMGIRAIARVLKASPASVLNWIRKEHGAIEQRLAEQTQPAQSGPADIIEMDEIYTYVQKNSSGQ